MKKDRYKIDVPIYNRTIHLILSEDIKASMEILRKQIPELSELDISPSGLFISPSTFTGNYYILLKPKSDIETISHECFHATITILGDSCLYIDKSNDEAYAYFNGWLNSEVHKRLKKYYEIQRFISGR